MAAVLVSIEFGCEGSPYNAMVSCASSSVVSCGKSNPSHKSVSESWSVTLSSSSDESSSDETILLLSVSIALSPSVSVSSRKSERSQKKNGNPTHWIQEQQKWDSTKSDAQRRP